MKTTLFASILMMTFTAFAGPISGGGAGFQFPKQPFSKICKVSIVQQHVVSKKVSCLFRQEGEFEISYTGGQNPKDGLTRYISTKQIDSKLTVTEIPEVGECHLLRPLSLESFLELNAIGTYAYLENISDDFARENSGYDSLRIQVITKDPTGKMYSPSMLTQELDLHQKALRFQFSANASSKLGVGVELRCREN